jgi:glycine/D-amino acid oxidase-like deaminating enzyme
VRRVSSSLANEQALVLGAGIQGVCAALALAGRGCRVTLIDEAPAPMSRASVVNEGKIHLGHVYANDPSFETPRLMLRAALSFAPLLERFIGRPIDWTALRASPFQYLVAADSQLTVDQLLAHYARLDAAYRDLLQENHESPGGSMHYLGARPVVLTQQVDLPAAVDQDRFAAAFATAETAVDPRRLREILARAVDESPLITTLYGHHVEDIRRTQGRFIVEGRASGRASWSRAADLVVNCLWTDRLRIDQQMGISSQRAWVYRLKYRVLVDLPDHMVERVPSLTIVLGKYGDVVTYPGARSAYLSWYPSCLQGWACTRDIPPAWRGPIDGRVEPETATRVSRGTLQAFDALLPGLGRATVTDVRAGVIGSWGRTDIDDPRSELHERRDIGVLADGRYFSIDTGKFTCAPFFAARLLDALN